MSATTSNVRRFGLTLAAVLAALAAASASAQAGVFNPLWATPPVAGEFCGTDVATGDVNGDGYDDVVIGCPNSNVGATKAGRAIVFTFRAFDGMFNQEVLTPAAPTANAFCGRSVAIGDVNGDGRADVALGCDGADPGGHSGAGQVLLFKRNGSNSGFDAPTPLNAAAPQDGEQCGGSLAMGDFSGDGKADIAAGCDTYDTPATSAGRVITFSDAALNPGVRVRSSAAAYDRCGASVAIGDVDGDHIGDVVAGCWGTGVRGAVVFRSSGGQSEIKSGVVNSYCGRSVAVGDVTGDGIGDLVTGCDSITPAGSDQWSGGAAVWTSTGGGFSATPYWLYPPSPVSEDKCGTSVAVGGVLGDARNDVVIGCPYTDVHGTDAGSVITFQRTAANDGFAAGVPSYHPSASAGDRCGYRTVVADVNGDDGGDITTGCYNRTQNGQANSGGAFVSIGEGQTPITNPGPPTPTPQPQPPVAPDPPGPPAPKPPAEPDPLAHLPHIPSIRIGQDDAFMLPELVCTRGGACFVLVDAKTSTSKKAFASAAKPKCKSKSRKCKQATKKRSSSFAVIKTTRFKLKGGERRKLKLKLNSRAAKLMRSRGKLVVTFTIKISRTGSATQTIRQTTTLRPAAKTKKNAKSNKKATKKPLSRR